MCITARNDEESIRHLLMVMLAVPGALWATSCLFLVFIGRDQALLPKKQCDSFYCRLLHKDRRLGTFQGELGHVRHLTHPSSPASWLGWLTRRNLKTTGLGENRGLKLPILLLCLRAAWFDPEDLKENEVLEKLLKESTI